MKNYIPRHIEKEVLNSSQLYPVVTITGPRQSGKTALVKHLFPNKPYINLENPDTRSLYANDPRSLFTRYPEGAILDEIQRLPELLSYIQTYVDEQDKQGLFILTGSHQLLLHAAITQSLAGRTALLTLLPLSRNEIPEHQNIDIDTQILQGFYPRLYLNPKITPLTYYRNYYQTYVERDVRMLIHLKDLTPFQHLLRLCAGRIGQLVNLQSLSNEIGVSANTINNWLSILEASFIIVRIQPYFENINTRMVKTPKIYFTDVGLACYLLGIRNTTQLTRDPLRGHLIENFVCMELLKNRHNLGLDPNLYFYRDHQGHEVDFVYHDGPQLIPIEVKSTHTFHPSLSKNLEFLYHLLAERTPQGFLIYAGPHQTFKKTTLCTYDEINSIFKYDKNDHFNLGEKP